MYEIERKFLVNSNVSSVVKNTRYYDIEQYYLADNKSWTLRYRKTTCIDGVIEYIMTMKKKKTILTSHEIETTITKDFFDEVIKHCGAPIIKRRYITDFKDKQWEIDFFHNKELGGLVMAEIELNSEDEYFEMPFWVEEEITSNKKYKNSVLAKRLQN